MIEFPGARVTAAEFSPSLLRLERSAPAPMRRVVLWVMLGALVLAFVWALIGRLDIIAVAPGKLVPQSFLQVVQPAEAGIVKEVLVREGDAVKAGQVLVRMETTMSEADRSVLANEIASKRLQLRRIDAELNGGPLQRAKEDPPAMFAQVDAQLRAHRLAFQDSIDTERAVLAKAEHDLQSSIAQESKLQQTVPIYREQEQAFGQLMKDGFAGRLMALERTRDRVEKEQDLHSQTSNVAALRASIQQSQKRIAQVTSNLRQQLQNERVEADVQHQKLAQEWEKLEHRHALLELRAPQDAIVKDLATRTAGTVLSPGAIVMTLVPHNDPMLAEVLVSGIDAGFVKPRQTVKLKFATYPFQQYGMVDGAVQVISPDSSDPADPRTDAKRNSGTGVATELGYRALISLRRPFLERDGERFVLAPGMQLTAEIDLGTRTVMEYVLSPLQKTVHEAGRER